MRYRCWFMFDRHAFTKVEGDNIDVVKRTLAELHSGDGWYGLHGRWEINGQDEPGIDTWHGDPRIGQDNLNNLYNHLDAVAAKPSDE